jgi:hypothetical protein
MTIHTTTNATKTGFWAKTWQVLRALDEVVSRDPVAVLHRRIDLLQSRLDEQMVDNHPNNGKRS